MRRKDNEDGQIKWDFKRIEGYRCREKYFSWLAVIDSNYPKNDTFNRELMESLSISNGLTIGDMNITRKLEYKAFFLVIDCRNICWENSSDIFFGKLINKG